MTYRNLYYCNKCQFGFDEFRPGYKSVKCPHCGNKCDPFYCMDLSPQYDVGLCGKDVKMNNKYISKEI